ncbi:MAG TPA: hypothetical protein DDW50_18370 [Firmicutes bacterium]|jgi:cystathionine beta-lyase/cystathionine gamma-synthase|nr:hypothetical protein [Bacillota bacterium]
MKNELSFDTKVVQLMGHCPTTGSIIPPIYQSATFVLEEIGISKGYDYTRSSNPSRETLEFVLKDLEGGVAAASFSSGMSAIDAVMKLLNTGDHIICSKDVYGGVTRLMTDIISRQGIDASFVDTSNIVEIEEALRQNTKMVYVETPSNPLLKITDIEKVSQITKKNHIILCVDSTIGSPALINPLKLGADLVVHSVTKYISGHSLIIGGAVISKDQELADHIRFIQKSIGAVPSPFDCWLTLIGLKTLAIRMNKHSNNALLIAKFLEGHHKISKVNYPGLESHFNHEVALRQMKNFSGLMSFEIDGTLSDCKRFLNNLRIGVLAESLGSVETMFTHPATMTHKDVPPKQRQREGLTDSLIRLSVGIENSDDLLEDIRSALQAI